VGSEGVSMMIRFKQTVLNALYLRRNPLFCRALKDMLPFSWLLDTFLDLEMLCEYSIRLDD
jgi:hypothetical protein